MREYFTEGHRSIDRRHRRSGAQVVARRQFAAPRDFIFVYFFPYLHRSPSPIPPPYPYPPCRRPKTRVMFYFNFLPHNARPSPADHQRSSDGIVHAPVLFYAPAHYTETHIRTRTAHMCVFFFFLGPLTLPPPAMRGASRMACWSHPIADVQKSKRYPRPKNRINDLEPAPKLFTKNLTVSNNGTAKCPTGQRF